MERLLWTGRTRCLALALAAQVLAFGCTNIEPVPTKIGREGQALSQATIPKPGNVAEHLPTAIPPVAGVTAPAPVDLEPGEQRPDKVSIPTQQPDRVLYRGKEALGDFDAMEPKVEKDLPVRQPPAVLGALSGQEYRRRADIYLNRWEQEKQQYTDLSASQQEAIKAQLKREVVGE
ncbi:MAG TPA: hypothetical protein VG963_24385 [Polyangiaceae bacterium]|nr:hypothetical protein [Polyangiaceae bacterium]